MAFGAIHIFKNKPVYIRCPFVDGKGTAVLNILCPSVGVAEIEAVCDKRRLDTRKSIFT